MKNLVLFLLITVGLEACNAPKAGPKVNNDQGTTDQKPATSSAYYIDVHDLGAGNVTAEAVAGAHLKDLEIQDNYGVKFIKYWVDEAQGKVYCLSRAKNPEAITETHRHAHGLLPGKIHEVTPGVEAAMKGDKKLFLDIHELGAGNVTAQAVEEAHQKDLEVQGKFGVNFINYWVDEETGTVMCLSEAEHHDHVVHTHGEAHGLLPESVAEVIQGE